VTTFDLFTFGETMVRLSVPRGERLETAPALELRIGGTESNVAVAMARLGRDVSWCSALPENALGRRVAHELQWHGVDTSAVQWTTNARVGVYFLDTGSPPRPTQVIYDRKDSAVSRVDPEQFDPAPATRARVVHLTGITPALSHGCADVCNRLARKARSAGVPVSFDVNYRSLLWSPEEAAEGLGPLCGKADILFCGREDAETIWGISGEPEEVLRELGTRFDSQYTVMTFGDKGAMLRTRAGDILSAPAVSVDIVDPVGAGDAFAAGFLHGFLDGDLDAALRIGTAMAALKMTMHGDLAIITPAELDTALAQHRRRIVR
jgi:2-dehydro-3-deoxygluconokinase